ncbi:hypothetical protein BDR03DRAFT_974754, partial [Suillus americanus]
TRKTRLVSLLCCTNGSHHLHTKSSSSNRTFISSCCAFASLYITRSTSTNEWQIKVVRSDLLSCGRSWSFTFLKISLQQ